MCEQQDRIDEVNKKIKEAESAEGATVEIDSTNIPNTTIETKNGFVKKIIKNVE